MPKIRPKICRGCDEEFVPRGGNQVYCDDCFPERDKSLKKSSEHMVGLWKKLREDYPDDESAFAAYKALERES